MAVAFQKATKTQARLRLALIGPAGSGKTYTALSIATYLGKRVAVVDTEHGSAAKYADLYEFDTAAITDHSPESYIQQIKTAEGAGYDVVILDSLTHEWKWCLEEVDNVKARMKTSNSFVAWKDVTPRHNALTEAILASGCHVIGTMRAKTEYVLEDGERGQKVPRKIGMAPVQREGVEFEFDLIGDLDMENTMVVSKTRCPALAGKVIRKPGKDLAEALRAWLTDGAPVPEPALVPVEKQQHAHLHAILKELHDAGVKPPDEFATWNEWTKFWAQKNCLVESRADLTYEQMAALIATVDVLRAQVSAGEPSAQESADGSSDGADAAADPSSPAEVFTGPDGSQYELEGSGVRKTGFEPPAGPRGKKRQPA